MPVRDRYGERVALAEPGAALAGLREFSQNPDTFAARMPILRFQFRGIA